jgi:hypothetical protein
MKQEDPDQGKNSEERSAPQNPGKRAKKEKKQKVVDGVQLPVLVEFTHTVSAIFLVFVGVGMILISFLTGASLINLVLRTSVALLVIGSLLLLITSQVSSGLLQASLAEQEEAQKSQTEEAHPTASPVIIEQQKRVEA